MFCEVNELIDISVWTHRFMGALEETFSKRVWFVGLQGSYARGEATEKSDIDMVVILDEVSPADIVRYDRMLDTLPHRALACGFLCGQRQLLSWEPSDLFQLYYDTKPLYGTLDALLPLLDDKAVERAVKIGACNLYHGCVHNMLYEKSEEVLKGLYKLASFVVQAIVFQRTGRYTTHQKDLLFLVNENERVIIETFLQLKNGGEVSFDAMSEILFMFSKSRI